MSWLAEGACDEASEAGCSNPDADLSALLRWSCCCRLGDADWDAAAVATPGSCSRTPPWLNVISSTTTEGPLPPLPLLPTPLSPAGSD